MQVVALVPARSGSKRVPDKNVRELAGKPLIWWTLKAAWESNVFNHILVSTDSERYAEMVGAWGHIAVMRPAEYSTDTSPDFHWVCHALASPLLTRDAPPDFFSILRPTSPFRTAETIRRAWEQFHGADCDSLRAVELCRQHPAKMWTVMSEGRMVPYSQFHALVDGQPAHSVPYQSLPVVYAQNASLEMARVDVLATHKNISGSRIMPFFTKGFEGFDINTEEDWERAEMLAERLLR